MLWNQRQRTARLMLGAALLTCAIVLARPQLALAGWPLESAAPVALSFGATYTSAEATSASTHRGVDLLADAGARVVAPWAGTVRFSGRVPAIGGGTVRAVTVETAHGDVTLLPLQDASVAKGDAVDEGEALGHLAEGGDGSDAATHLHVGIRRGDLYVDPMSLMVPPVAAQQRDAAGQGAAADAGAGARSAAGAVAAGGVVAAGMRSPAPVPGQVIAAGVTVAGPVSAAAAAHGATRVARSLGSVTVTTDARAAAAGARLAPGVTLGATPAHLQGSMGSAALERVATRLQAALHPKAVADAKAASHLLDALVVRARGSIGHVARVAGLLGGSILASVGLLWPLWRRERGKEAGQDSVSPAVDDVAAAVGRC